MIFAYDVTIYLTIFVTQIESSKMEDLQTEQEDDTIDDDQEGLKSGEDTDEEGTFERKWDKYM